MWLCADELRARIGDEAFYVTQQKGTERPHTSHLNKVFDEGTYHCVVCGSPLFESSSKFKPHCGWPAFDRPISKDALAEHRDVSHGMVRTEVTCGKCGAHQGHVFDDGPTETGIRYCINGVAINFKPKGK